MTALNIAILSALGLWSLAMVWMIILIIIEINENDHSYCSRFINFVRRYCFGHRKLVSKKTGEIDE